MQRWPGIGHLLADESSVLPHTRLQRFLAWSCLHLLLPTVLQVICIYVLVAVSVFSSLVAVRISNIGSLRAVWRSNIVRKMALAVLINAWVFSLTTGVLMFGLGTGMNDAGCSAAIYFCVVAYCASKAFGYRECRRQTS